MSRAPSPFVDVKFREQFIPYLHPYASGGEVHLSANMVGARFSLNLSPAEARHLADILVAEADIAERGSLEVRS